MEGLIVCMGLLSDPNIGESRLRRLVEFLDLLLVEDLLAELLLFVFFFCLRR
jgi:hypothetical protein